MRKAYSRMVKKRGRRSGVRSAVELYPDDMGVLINAACLSASSGTRTNLLIFWSEFSHAAGESAAGSNTIRIMTFCAMSPALKTCLLN